jgi:hypothetical protein
MSRGTEVSATQKWRPLSLPKRLRRLLVSHCRRAAHGRTPRIGTPTAATKAIGLVCMCLFLAGHTAAAVAPEYKGKAALILKIGKFVRWPVDAFSGVDGAFRLCIVGRDDFGDSIDTLGGKTLQGRFITIARLPDPEQSASDCQIVFISASERERVPEFLKSIARSPILTISDIDGFASEGGMVGIAASVTKVHFEINAAASKRARLEIGAQLLQLATLITDQRVDIAP